MQGSLLSLEDLQEQALRLLSRMAVHPDATDGAAAMLHVAGIGVRQAVKRSQEARQTPQQQARQRVNRELDHRERQLPVGDR